MFDAEQILDALESTLKAELNNKITAIQSEKDALLGANNIELPLIPDDAYFATLDQGIANYSHFIYFGFEDVPLDGIQGATAQEVRPFFFAVSQVENSTFPAYKQTMRYTRAMKEVIEENAFNFQGEMSYPKLEVMNPTPLRDLEGQEFAKIGGIVVSTSIA